MNDDGRRIAGVSLHPSSARPGPWPELPWRDWEPTISTLHMWLQIVGKVRLALAPPLNHWWHVPLYVTARGLTTSPIPYGDGEFQVDFDFVEHRLCVTDADRAPFTMALEPLSVARFYREFLAGLRSRGVDVAIWPHPVEVADAIPFEQDERHAAYDPAHAQLLWRALVQVDRVLKRFQTGFVGKASPVHLFWGGFDLATTRYSGRPAPRHPGGVPELPGLGDGGGRVAPERDRRLVAAERRRPVVLLVRLPGAKGLRGRHRSSGSGVLRRSPRRVPVAVRRDPHGSRSGRGCPGIPALDLRGGCRPRRVGSSRPRAGRAARPSAATAVESGPMTFDLAAPVDATDHVRGDGGPQLVVYGDFECPYTAEAMRSVGPIGVVRCRIRARVPAFSVV